MYEEFLEYIKDKNIPLPTAKAIAFSFFSDILDREGFAEENATTEARDAILTKWVEIAQGIITG